jgi:hypothetical protein
VGRATARPLDSLPFDGRVDPLVINDRLALGDDQADTG